MHLEEQVGSVFDAKIFTNAQLQCKSIVEKIAKAITPGISEAQGQILIKKIFAQEGITKFWHPSKFRFGPDTIKTFREFPDPNLRLKESDIYFLDVGPVIQGHEADYGQTFFLGSSTELQSLKLAAQEVWQATATHWQEEKCTGPDLYSFAQKEAERKGLRLDDRMNGHRLGDFPHALYSKRKLQDFDQSPSPQRWVLEIHLVSQDLERGAFFEDIL